MCYLHFFLVVTVDIKTGSFTYFSNFVYFIFLVFEPQLKKSQKRAVITVIGIPLLNE